MALWWQLFLFLVVFANKFTFNERLLRMNEAELGVVVDDALKMMQMTEALDKLQEIAVGKEKKKKKREIDGRFNHKEDKFISWLAQKAKEEHKRTSLTARSPGPRRTPGATPPSSRLENRAKTWKSQKEMRKDAKQAKKDSKKAQKKMKKMEKKVTKLRGKIFKKDLKMNLKAIQKNTKGFVKEAKLKIKRVQKKEKRYIKKAAKKARKIRRNERKADKKVKKVLMQKKLQRYEKKEMKKEKKLLKKLAKPVKDAKKLAMSDGKFKKKLKKAKKQIKKVKKKAEKDAYKAFSKGMNASGDNAQDEMLNLSGDPFAYFKRRGKKKKSGDFGHLWDKKFKEGKSKKKESAVWESKPETGDEISYLSLFPPLPKF